MLLRHEVFAQLANALSGIYLDHDRASGVAQDAGLDLKTIKSDPIPLNYWRNILKEAENQQKTEALLEIALTEYSKEPNLQEVHKTYQDWVTAGRPEASSEISVGTPIANRVLFDESHGQDLWWHLPPTLDQGFKRLGELTKKRFPIASLAGNKKITSEQLSGSKALILAVGPQGKTQLDQEEIDDIRDFVRNGGGLFVLGTYTGDWHHEANLNRLIEYYGIAFNRDVVLPESAEPQDCKDQSPQYSPEAKSVVVARPDYINNNSTTKNTWSILTRQVDHLLALSSCSLYVEEAKAIPLLASGQTSVIQEPVPLGIGIHIDKCQVRGNGPATLLAASKFSKVIVSGNYKMFLNDFIDYPGSHNRKLWENILRWLTD
jgi:hypothetical protein